MRKDTRSLLLSLTIASFTIAGAVMAAQGCRASTTDNPGAPKESPQASAQPAPLAATAPASAATAVIAEGGPPPSPFRGDEVLSPDGLGKESVGYTLSALLRHLDLPAPQRAQEVSANGLEAARKATELRLAVDLSPTRMRLAILGHGFVLPPDTEIRARSDRYGHVVVWPDVTQYRPLAPGSMRALLGERRLDVAPIMPAEVTLRDEGGRRIGIRTRRADVTTRAAHATFEIGKLEGAGEGGVLLCRLLLDLMNAPPGIALCAQDELPVRTELRWTSSHGALVFELTGALRRTDIPLASLYVPPQTASFAPVPLPTMGIGPMLSAQELTALRTNDIELPPPAPIPTPAANQPPPQPPIAKDSAGDILTLVNPTLELRVLYLDGIPVAWAAPQARGELHGLRRGRYVAQWRTFLGDAVDTPITQTVPGTTQVGAIALPPPVDGGTR